MALTVVQSIHTIIKLRRVIIALSVMQNIGVRAQEITGRDKLSLVYKNPNEAEISENTKEQYTKMIELINYHWFIIMVVTMIIAIIAVLGYKKLRSYIRKLYRMKLESVLAIQFSNGANSIVIRIQTFQATTDDLTITQENFIRKVKVIGFFNPMLTYIWDAEVRDNFINLTFPVKNRVRLTYAEAFVMRRVLTQNFNATPVFHSDGQSVNFTTRMIFSPKNGTTGNNTSRRASMTSLGGGPREGTLERSSSTNNVNRASITRPLASAPSIETLSRNMRNSNDSDNNIELQTMHAPRASKKFESRGNYIV
jgi:hypothetical protein